MKPNHLIATAVAVLLVLALALFAASRNESRQTEASVAAQQSRESDGTLPSSNAPAPDSQSLAAIGGLLDSTLNGHASELKTFVEWVPSGRTLRSHVNISVETTALDKCSFRLALTTQTQYEPGSYSPATDSTPPDRNETSVCTVNLAGLSDSSLTVSKQDMNDSNVNGGIGMKMKGDVRWLMGVADEERVDCTASPEKHAFLVMFNTAADANNTARKLKAFAHQYCEH